MENENKSKWGKGIPEYSEEDLMKPQDLYEFGIENLYQYLKKEGYEDLHATRNMSSMPSIYMRKNDKLYFVLVEVSVAPQNPELSSFRKFKFIKHSKLHNAIPLYAPLGFGSIDAERFSASLALKYDGYYLKYTGLKDVEPDEDLTSPYRLCECLDKIGKGYSNKNLDDFVDYLDEDITWFSTFSQSKYTNKKEVIDYYTKKFVAVKNTKIEYELCRDLNNTPLLFIGQDINGKKSGMLIKCDINLNGLISSLTIIDYKDIQLKFN